MELEENQSNSELEDNVSEGSMDSELKKAIKASLADQKKEDGEGKVKDKKEEKLTREMVFNFQRLRKDTFLVTPKGVAKVLQDPKENSDDIGKTKFKLEVDGKTENVTLDKLIMTTHKPVKIYLVNYMERVFQLTFYANVNDTFEDLKDNFCHIYNLDSHAVAVIYKSNKLGKKDFKKKFGKDFDFENDYFTFIQAEAKPEIASFGFLSFLRCPYSNNVPQKILFVLSDKIIVKSFYLSKAYYNGCNCNYTNFELSRVKTPLEDFRVKTKEDEKKKKGKSKNNDPYSFDKLFKNPDQYETSQLSSVANVDANKQGDESDNEESSEGSDSNSKSNYTKDRLKKNFANVEVGNLILEPEIVYQLKYEIHTYDTVNGFNLKNERVKKESISENIDITFYFPPLISQDNNKLLVFLGGMEFKPVTIFEE